MLLSFDCENVMLVRNELSSMFVCVVRLELMQNVLCRLCLIRWIVFSVSDWFIGFVCFDIYDLIVCVSVFMLVVVVIVVGSFSVSFVLRIVSFGNSLWLMIMVLNSVFWFVNIVDVVYLLLVFDVVGIVKIGSGLFGILLQFLQLRIVLLLVVIVVIFFVVLMLLLLLMLIMVVQ